MAPFIATTMQGRGRGSRPRPHVANLVESRLLVKRKAKLRLIPAITDIRQRDRHVGFVPQADIDF
jgi:hypothetical protein